MAVAEKAADGVSGVADYVSTHANGATANMANMESAKGADFKRLRLTPPYGAAEGTVSVEAMALGAAADLNATEEGEDESSSVNPYTLFG